MIELVLGGARSGKSHYAEATAASLDCSHYYYIATAEAQDAEMAQRIAQHQQDRLNAKIDWQLIEAPQDICTPLAQFNQPQQCIVIDCLTLWLTNLLLAGADINASKQALIDQLRMTQANVILVSNEVGLGIVPLGELSRRFVDEAGWLNQAIAKATDKVTFVAAGLPLRMKG